MMAYEDFTPKADKLLQPDGSVTTAAGAVVLPADPNRAADYASRSPQPAKWLLPDGSVTDKLPTSGGSAEPPTPPAPSTPINPVYFATTNTAAATAIKVLSGLPSGYVPASGDFLIMSYLTSGFNSATGLQFSIEGKTYQIRFNGQSTNALSGYWMNNARIPFYFDGSVFNQLMYPRHIDDNTTYTGFFEQTLTGVRVPINPDRDVLNSQLALERDDGTFDQPLLVTTNAAATNKAVNTGTTFEVDGMIFGNSTLILPKGSTMNGSVNQLLQTHQASWIISLAMNGAANLTQYSWVYLVGVPLTNPMRYKLDPANSTSWYTTTPPTTDDGKVYIRLGYYEMSNYFNLFAEHPAYWFKDGFFRPYLTRGA